VPGADAEKLTRPAAVLLSEQLSLRCDHPPCTLEDPTGFRHYLSRMGIDVSCNTGGRAADAAVSHGRHTVFPRWPGFVQLDAAERSALTDQARVA